MRNVLLSAVRLAERRRPAPPDSTAMLSALPVPVVVLDRENRLRFLNHAAEQFLGISASAAAQPGPSPRLSHDAILDIAFL